MQVRHVLIGNRHQQHAPTLQPRRTGHLALPNSPRPTLHRKTIPQRDSTLADRPFFCQDGVMARKKTTVYIDDELLRAAKVAAARSGKREYEVFEDALRQHLGLAGAIERIWAGISPQDAPSEQEAARIAAEELAAVRAERLAHRVS